MENLTVKIEGDTKELVIRQGSALPAREPNRINIAGNILAPGNWLDIRCGDPRVDNVQFSREKMEIVFTKNESDAYSTTIVGLLKLNEDLKKFKINENHLWATADLAKFLKMNRLFFADADQCGKIIVELNSLKAKCHVRIRTQK